jgi:hypothetical protein
MEIASFDRTYWESQYQDEIDTIITLIDHRLRVGLNRSHNLPNRPSTKRKIQRIKDFIYASSSSANNDVNHRLRRL